MVGAVVELPTEELPACGVEAAAPFVAAPEGCVVVVVVVVALFGVELLIVPVVLDEFAPPPTAPVVAVPVAPGSVVAVVPAAGCCPAVPVGPAAALFVAAAFPHGVEASTFTA